MSPTLSRRDWLRSAATTAFLTGAAQAGGGDGQRRKFTMDLVPHNVGASDRLPQAIDLAARHGFESVAPDIAYLRSCSPAQIHDLRDRLKASRLVWGAGDLLVEFRQDGDVFRAGLGVLSLHADALYRAGVTRMSTWLAPGHDRLTYWANFKQHVDRLRQVARVLADHGVRLGLEYVGPKTSWSASRYPFIHTMVEMRELIADINVPGVGLVLDSWHWYTAHETAADLRTLKNNDIVACDLNDAPAGIPVDQQKDLVRELPAATGVIDLKAFLGSLVEIGYDGPVRAEPFKAELNKMPPDQAVAATAAAMRKAFATID